MLLVVDANVLFSAVIKQDRTAELFFSDWLELITPEFIISEIRKYSDEILLKSHRSGEELNKFLLILEDKIDIIPSSELKPFLAEAELCCPDQKDVQYFAAALKYSCGLWSNDRALKKQDKVRVFSTSELLTELGL